MIAKLFLFGVTIRLKQLKVLGALCSLFKVIVDLGFLNYNQIYLFGINKTYSPPYNIYQLSTKLVRQNQLATSTDGVELVRARKKKFRRGHQVHLRKLISSVNHDLRDTDRGESNAELLSRKLQLERKAQIISKLDEEILEEIEVEGGIAHERETAEELHSEIAIFENRKRETVITKIRE